MPKASGVPNLAIRYVNNIRKSSLSQISPRNPKRARDEEYRPDKKPPKVSRAFSRRATQILPTTFKTESGSWDKSNILNMQGYKTLTTFCGIILFILTFCASVKPG
ncbi:hypothetical protein JTB14_037899 [Gonioctena quinquepunctata]|nr:hypothetical protein JTB14_037899 [Gonioctena quinquepunctata]